MSKNSSLKEFEEIKLELTIDDKNSEMIVKLQRIIESTSHKLPINKK
jgi:hypothetical protein